MKLLYILLELTSFEGFFFLIEKKISKILLKKLKQIQLEYSIQLRG